MKQAELNIVTICFLSTHISITGIYSLSLHDALPILTHDPVSGTPRGSAPRGGHPCVHLEGGCGISSQCTTRGHSGRRDRKSTRLNSSHVAISYAVFCLKKKKKNNKSECM